MASPDPSKQTLKFNTDRGASRSKWVAVILGLAMIGWMASGIILPTPEEQEDTLPSVRSAVTVATIQSTAEEIQQIFSAEGQAQPDRITEIRAESSGPVADLVARKGQFVERGDVIARLRDTDQSAQLTVAEEDLARAQREFDNAEALLERGNATADRVTTARAALAAAQAQMTRATEALDNTIIRAPFAGRLSALDIDEGEFVQAGGSVAEVLDSDPLTVVVQIPQQALSGIKEGQPAQVEFITGEERIGQISFVGINADSATRTFRAEVIVPNSDGALPSGISAQVRVATGSAIAHFISPATLSLGADGALGVMIVDENSRARFTPIEILRAQTDGIWVGGLPDQAQIITVGQGFVSDNQPVTPKADTSLVEVSQ
jgi:multidrug efflux system membrane fusion protein